MTIKLYLEFENKRVSFVTIENIILNVLGISCGVFMLIL